jgi:hypothetical protein
VFQDKKDPHKFVKASTPQQLMMKISVGDRFARQPGIPDPFWELITNCWQKSPNDRPTFEEIVRIMLARDDMVLEGTDKTKYEEYQERVKPPEDELIQVEMELRTSRGLLISQRAAGSRLLTDEMARSTRKSIVLGRVEEESSDADQAYRRYDFTRSSLRKATK